MYLLQTKQINHTNNKLLYPWKYSCDNSEILNNISELEIYYSQYCFPIIYKNRNYLITTAHNTNNSTEFYYHDLQLPIIIINYDLDIIILENIISDNIAYNFELKLNFVDQEIFNNNMHNIMLNYNKIYESNISFYTANILLIECDVLNNSKIIKGQSGLPIFNSNNDVIGIISRTNNSTNTLDLLPMINVYKLLDNEKLCYISEYLSIKNSELYIYKKSNKCTYKKKNYCSGTFKKNDIIYAVDKKKLVDGYIFDNILQIYVSLYVYILFNKNDKEKTNFDIFRNKKFIKILKYFKEFKEFKKINKTLITMNHIDDETNKLYYEYNENIINDYINKNIYIPKNIPLNFLDNINCCTELIQEENYKKKI